MKHISKYTIAEAMHVFDTIFDSSEEMTGTYFEEFSKWLECELKIDSVAVQ